MIPRQPPPSLRCASRSVRYSSLLASGRKTHLGEPLGSASIMVVIEIRDTSFCRWRTDCCVSLLNTFFKEKSPLPPLVTVFSNVQSPVFLCSPEHQSVNKQGFGLSLSGMVGSFFHSYDSSDVDISRFSLRSLRFNNCTGCSDYSDR